MRVCLSNINRTIQPYCQPIKPNDNVGSFKADSSTNLVNSYYLPLSFCGKVKKNRYEKQQTPNQNVIVPAPQDFHTIEGYKTLDKRQRGLLLSESAKVLTEEHCFCSDEGMNAFLANTKEIMDACKDNGFHLFKPTQKPHIAILGRSLLWFAEAAKLTDKDISDYTYVPFSYGKSLYSIHSPNRMSHSRPTLCQLNSYREHLKELRMDPTSIINRAKAGQKTIITDYAATGESLLAFLEILKDWATEQGNFDKLRKSAKVVFVVSNPSIYSKFLGLYRQIQKLHDTRGKTVTIDDFSYSQVEISDKVYHLTLGKHFDELEPPYPTQAWETKPKKGPLSRNAYLAKFRLIDYLTKHRLLALKGKYSIYSSLLKNLGLFKYR